MCKSMVRRGQCYSFEGEVVPVKYSSWKERKFVVISGSSYQSVGQRVIMSRGSYTWDQKVRNRDGNQIMGDVIHKRLERVCCLFSVGQAYMLSCYQICNSFGLTDRKEARDIFV